MKANPDIYLLYEYMKKIPFTVRIKVVLDAPVDEGRLKEAAREAIRRFPYFAVQLGLDAGGNYVLSHNERPLPVLPEQDRRLVLGSEETNGHLFAVTWRGDTVWFNFSHSVCGGFGAMFWVKTTLYRYLTKLYGSIAPPADLKLPDSPVSEGELFYPDPDTLPTDEPLARYTGGSTNVGLGTTLLYMLNPFVKDCYYYQLEIPKTAFMTYNKSVDASPNSILAALLFKTVARLFPEKKGQHLSAKIAADFRKDVGCPDSYRDFVRFLHVKYDWSMAQEPIEKLNMRARGAIISQSEPEQSCEVFRQREALHAEIDAQPDLKSKKAYALQNSPFRKDVRDTFTVSYVGNVDWGGLAEHIKDVYTITDGNLMFEVNALPDKFCITFQMMPKKRTALDLFCAVLDEEKLPYTVSERMTRYLPEIRLPE